jgi:hypothetical protein
VNVADGEALPVCLSRLSSSVLTRASSYDLGYLNISGVDGIVMFFDM